MHQTSTKIQVEHGWNRKTIYDVMILLRNKFNPYFMQTYFITRKFHKESQFNEPVLALSK